MRSTNGRRRRGEGGFKVLISLTILFVAGYAAFKIVPVHLQGNELTDAMDEAANFAGMKPLDKLKYDIFQKAQKAGLAININDIKIERRGPNILISCKYQRKVDVLGYEYVYDYDKTIEKTIF